MTYVRATDGIRLHYARTGRPGGPPVVMIQGLGADKHLWDLQRLALGPRYHTIALDNRGAGRSDKPFGTYSLAQMAADVITALYWSVVNSPLVSCVPSRSQTPHMRHRRLQRSVTNNRITGRYLGGRPR